MYMDLSNMSIPSALGHHSGSRSLCTCTLTASVWSPAPGAAPALINILCNITRDPYEYIYFVEK